MTIKKYKTTSCVFDESDELWCADIDTANSDKCPKIGELVEIDGGTYVVRGIQGYHDNFSIKFLEDKKSEVVL